MTQTLTVVAIGALALGTVACTDSERARRAATFADQPAEITCWTYGTENFRGRSTGKVEYDEGGRISFVDARNDRYTTIEGECRVVYLSEGADASAPESPVTPVAPGGPGGPIAPPPAVPEA